MWVDVPTPFKKGDILYGSYPFVMGYGHCEPFVLLDVCNNKSKERTNKLRLYFGLMKTVSHREHRLQSSAQTLP